MFSKILVATDLSIASERMIESLRGLDPLGVSEILLVHVLNLRDVGTMGNSLKEAAEPLIKKQQAILEKMGYLCTSIIALGLPHIEINRITEENNCSMMVVGSQGETMAREILLGGIASEVIHNAVKPVLVLKMKKTEMSGEVICEEVKCDPLEHILFPTDFSDNAEKAFITVREMANIGAKRMTLIHVQDQEKIGRHLLDRLEEFNRLDMERLERIKSVLENEGVPKTVIELPYGSPKQKILDRIRKGDISFVVMGSQGRGFISELFLGSVSLFVARHSSVPVLLIPAQRE